MYMFVLLFLMTIVQFQLSSSLDELSGFLLIFITATVLNLISTILYLYCHTYLQLLWLWWSHWVPYVKQEAECTTGFYQSCFYVVFFHLEFILYHSWSVYILQTYGLLYDSALTWFIRYIHYTNLQLLNNIIIIKIKVILPHARVTLADFEPIMFNLLALNAFFIIWFTNLLILRVPDEGYSRNASSALN